MWPTSHAAGPVRAPSTRRPRHGGLTIVELLVAMVISLLLILAVLQAFQVAAATISDSRASLEMAGRLRGVTTQLQQDLNGVTLAVRPWPNSSSAWGYFEYYDGPSRDADSDADGTVDVMQGGADTTVGDIDDILMFTSRREGLPFQGRQRSSWTGTFTYLQSSSTSAEVIWWTGYDDVNANSSLDPGDRLTLHRRALLIRPDLNDSSTGLLYTVGTLVQAYAELKLFHHDNDISARVAASQTNANLYGIAANSLADLMNRNNRFAHVPSPVPSYPFAGLDIDVVTYKLLNPVYRQIGDFEGEDVTLTHVLAFDVRAFDPDAPLLAAPSSDLVGPSDAGFAALAYDPSNPGKPLPKVGAGAYVDLNYDPHPTRRRLPIGNAGRLSAFSGVPVFFDTNGNSSWDFQPPVPPSFGERPAGTPGAYVLSTMPLRVWYFGSYDTWSTQYESDGLDQDGSGVADQGTDGFDNDGVGGVDDPNERETSPPYPVPLRGIEVLVRMLEPDTRQVRQSSVTADFVEN